MRPDHCWSHVRNVARGHVRPCREATGTPAAENESSEPAGARIGNAERIRVAVDCFRRGRHVRSPA